MSHGDVDIRPDTDARRSQRWRATAVLAQAHLRDLVPPVHDRCGTPLVGGTVRAVAADLAHRLTHRRTALVSLPGGASLAVDLATPHGRRWYAWGCCEPATRVLRSLLNRGDVVVDAGANIGVFSLIAAARVGPTGRVVACEPAPETMALLRRNVARNRYGWVELRDVAVAEAPGRLELEVFAAGSGFSSFAPADAGQGRRVEVTVTTLDDLAGDLLERVRLVKLDVEGAELRALQGAAHLLARTRPDFIVELEPDHLQRQGSTVGDLQALFEAHDYAGFALEDGRLQPMSGTWHRGAGDPNIVVRPRERITT